MEEAECSTDYLQIGKNVAGGREDGFDGEIIGERMKDNRRHEGATETGRGAGQGPRDSERQREQFQSKRRNQVKKMERNRLGQMNAVGRS